MRMRSRRLVETTPPASGKDEDPPRIKKQESCESSSISDTAILHKAPFRLTVWRLKMAGVVFVLGFVLVNIYFSFIFHHVLVTSNNRNINDTPVKRMRNNKSKSEPQVQIPSDVSSAATQRIKKEWGAINKRRDSEQIPKEEESYQTTTTTTQTSYRVISPAKIVTIETILEDNAAVAPTSKGQVWLAGIILDPANIADDVFDSIIQLNCDNKINVHVVTAATESSLYAANARYQKLTYNNSSCGQFIVTAQPPHISSLSLRVDKIAAARDYQRDELQNLFYNNNNDNNNAHNTTGLVILTDFDLASFPNVDQVIRQVKIMMYRQNNKSSISKQHYNIVCATGIMHRPYGYYDTFATVLLPDTFVYPIRGRLTRTFNEKEDYSSLIRSDDVYGTVTQFDLLDFFETKSRLRDDHPPLPGNRDPFEDVHSDDFFNQFVQPVPVKSCFGGFTIYNAATYFNPKCNYSAPYQRLYDGKQNMTLEMKKYSSLRSQRPCEHVMFHNCLQRANKGKALAAVNPRLRSEWNKRVVFGNRLNVGKTRHDGLNTYFNQRTRGERLISSNGRYTLRINQKGTLGVEEWLGDNSTSKLIWSPPIKSAVLQSMSWTHMFLWLKGDGTLQLIKHVPLTWVWEDESYVEQCDYYSSNSSQILSVHTPCLCNPKLDACDVLLWSQEFVSQNKILNDALSNKFSLNLFDDGSLSVSNHNEDGELDRVLWEARAHRKEKKRLDVPRGR